MKAKDQSRPYHASVTWTKRAKRSLARLKNYMDAYALSDSWSEEIAAAIGELTFFPFRCAVICKRDGREIRRLVVDEYILVYYIYFSSRTPASRGRISIRGVSHAARRNPLSGVREKDEDEFDSRFGWQLRDSGRLGLGPATPGDRLCSV